MVLASHAKLAERDGGVNVITTECAGPVCDPFDGGTPRMSIISDALNQGFMLVNDTVDTGSVSEIVIAEIERS